MGLSIDMSDLLDKVYLGAGIVLAILLIISEILGWTRCVSNSITEYLYRKFLCGTTVSPEEGENNWSQETPGMPP